MHLQPGDILACYGGDWRSRVIRYATMRPVGPKAPSHVGIVADLHVSGTVRRLLVESTTFGTEPCEVTHADVNGVQAHSPDLRIADYRESGGWVDVYRLTEFRQLEKWQHEKLTAMCQAYLGRPYDTFGAGLSTTRILMWLLSQVADVTTVFCSELVAAVLQALGLMNLSNPASFNPRELIRELTRTGVYAYHKGYA